MSHVKFHGYMHPRATIRIKPSIHWDRCLMIAGAVFLTLLALACKASLYWG